MQSPRNPLISASDYGSYTFPRQRAHTNASGKSVVLLGMSNATGYRVDDDVRLRQNALNTRLILARVLFAMAGNIVFTVGSFSNLTRPFTIPHINSLFYFATAVGSLSGGICCDALSAFSSARFACATSIAGYLLLIVAVSSSPPTTWLVMLSVALLGAGAGISYPLSITLSCTSSNPARLQRRLALTFAMQICGYVWGEYTKLTCDQLPGISSYAKDGLFLSSSMVLPFLCLRYIATNASPTYYTTGLLYLDQRHELPLIGHALQANRRSLITASAAWFTFDFVKYGAGITSNIFQSDLDAETNSSDVKLQTSQFTLLILLPALAVSYWLAARWERRKLQVCGALLLGACFLAQALAIAVPFDSAPPVVGISILVVFVNYGTVDMTTFVVAGDTAPRDRKEGSFVSAFAGVAAFWGKLGAVLGDLILGWALQKRLHVKIVSAVVMLMLAALTWWLLPARPRRAGGGGKAGTGGGGIDQQPVVDVKADDFVIPFKLLTVGRPVAEGGQGQVHSGSFAGQQVACKQVKSTMLAEDMQAFNHEATMMARIQHPRVARFYGVSTHVTGSADEGDEYTSHFLISEWCDGDTLFHRITATQEPTNVRLTWAWQMCEALRFLHYRHKPIAHLDIKPTNVMLDFDDNVKVVDLGTATLLRGSGKNELRPTGAIGGTAEYLAPELLTHINTPKDKVPSTDGARVDVFAAGLTIAFIFSGVQPYEKEKWHRNPENGKYDPSPDKIISHVKDGGAPDVDLRAMPPDIQTIILSMICNDPEQRPTIGQVADDLKRLLDEPVSTTAATTPPSGGILG